PLIRDMLGRCRNLAASERGIMCRSDRLVREPAVLSVWRIEIHGAGGYFRQAVVPLAVDATGHRVQTGDVLLNGLREVQPALAGAMDLSGRIELVSIVLPEMLRREAEHRGLLREDSSLALQLVAWIEFE